MDKILNFPGRAACVLFFVTILLFSCVNKSVTTLPDHRADRIDQYMNSNNEHIALLFSDGEMNDNGLSCFFTKTELDILDKLCDKISPDVKQVFDSKYIYWLKSWTPSLDEGNNPENIYSLLKTGEEPFHELMNFCLQQDDQIFLLFYQLAVRAVCPYDQYLLYPAHRLYSKFPEFGEYWSNVSENLIREKPDPESRSCNESTIWGIRKVMESKYGYTYVHRLASLFESRR